MALGITVLDHILLPKVRF